MLTPHLPSLSSSRPARRWLRPVVVAALLLPALGVQAADADADELPPVQTSGEVHFITGGVGQAQAAALRQARANYRLSVEVYASEGGRQLFTADDQVTVRNARGETVLQERTGGPYLLADVPPGRYTVEAEHNGNTQRKAVTLRGQGTARVVFVFKSG